MKGKGKKVSQKTSRTRTTSTKGTGSSSKTKAGKSETTESGPVSEQFVRGVLVRGEAAKPDAEGKLPLEATHAITEEKEDGTVEVKRARYKTF
jgi:hypothetical protein